MNNFLLTLNIILPIFLVMAVGFFCRRIKLVNAENISAINKLVFRIFLPASLCQSLMRVEPGSIVNPGVLGFGFAGTLLVFLIALLVIPQIEKDNRRRGVMIQGIFRSNYAIFGIPLSEALFPQGDGGLAAMMVIATVPIFNVLGVIALESFRGGRVNIRKILIGIAKNPLIWGCLIGYLLMKLQVPVPTFATSTLSKLAAVASPLALFALGGSIDLQTFAHNARPLSITVLSRLVVVPVLVLLAAYAVGYRGVEFAVLMIVFGSPCAVNSYTMAAQMDGDAELAAQQVMLTTIFSSVSMFAMIFLFKSLGIF
ncbi:MAG: AEC family transporter [Candidatus Faecivicinus sp.]